MLTKVVRELNLSVPVYLLHGAMSDDEIAGLYRNDKIKALVAPTRGEGYGLPLLEAAASGLPVMATNWSGHKDFLNTGKWINFDYRLQDVAKQKIDNNIFAAGCYNGSGIGVGTLFGEQIALKASNLNTNEIETIEARDKPTWLPPEPFLSLGVKTRLIYERLRARSEI